MVYYTFSDVTVPNWQQKALINKAKEVMDMWGFEPRVLDYEQPKPKWRFDGGNYPYIEINGPYGWLTIRRLTHMEEEEREHLVDELEDYYKELKEFKSSGDRYQDRYSGKGKR